MPDKASVQSDIKSFILKEFLEGAKSDELTPSTPLMTSGILDSIGIIKLVAFLEKNFRIDIEAHEADPERFATVDAISELVLSKV